MDRIDAEVRGPEGIKLIYTGYTGAPLTPTVRVRCKVCCRQDDCLLVRPESAMSASVWVHDSDVEILEGESKIGYLSCFLDEIGDGWVYVTVPCDASWKRVAIPFASLDHVTEPISALVG